MRLRCLKCGYEINAEYNSTKNIGVRYMRQRQHRLRSLPMSGNADASVDVRIHGWMLGGDGIGQPPRANRRESTLKPHLIRL